MCFPVFKYFFRKLEKQFVLKICSPFPNTIETVDSRYCETSRKILNHWFSDHPVRISVEELEQLIIESKVKCGQDDKGGGKARRISIAHIVKGTSAKRNSFVENLLVGKSNTNKKEQHFAPLTRSISDEESALEKFSSRLVSGCGADQPEDHHTNDNQHIGGTGSGGGSCIKNDRLNLDNYHTKISGSDSSPNLALSNKSSIQEYSSSQPGTPSTSPTSSSPIKEFNTRRSDSNLDKENLFLERANHLLQFSESIEKTVQSTLTLILNYSQGSEIYLVRSTKSKTLVVDGAVGESKVWSTLQNVPISQIRLFSENILQESKNTKKLIYLTTSHEIVKKGSDYYIHNSPETIFCLPVFLHGKFRGALYLIHSSVSYAFQNIKSSVVSLVLLNLLSMINEHFNSFNKTQRALSLGCGSITKNDNYQLKKDKKNLLQDSIYVYDPNTGQWNLMFVTLSEDDLCIYSSPFDTHPIRTIPNEEFEDIQVSSKQLKQKNIRFDVWPVLPLKFKAKNSLIYIQSSNDTHTWLALESIKILHNWYDILVQCRKANKKDIKQITLKDIPVNIRINPEEIVVGSVVGNGGAATVYKGTWNNNTVAIKRLHDTCDQKEIKEFFDEVKILHTLRHPCIVTLMGGFVNDEGRPSIVFEYADRGSLNDVLYDQFSGITNSLKLEFIKQICQALHYLHSFDPPIIHRDLKPANILVSVNLIYMRTCFFVICKKGGAQTSVTNCKDFFEGFNFVPFQQFFLKFLKMLKIYYLRIK